MNCGTWANKQYGTGILAGEATRLAAGDRFAWREIDRVAVLGRTEATTVYELIGRTDELSASENDLCVTYENALRAYYAGDFENACKQFVEILCVHPDDSASSVLLKRCKGLAESPPADWSGVFIAGRK